MNETSVSAAATSGILWSIVQNWGGKIITFGLSVLLARLLTPEEFGVASSAALILMLVPMVAEFGLGDAIMQRRNLAARELNLPFYISVALVLFLVTIVVLFSHDVGHLMGVDDFSIYVIAIVATMIINAPSLFQEAMYKRNMQFRSLALRTFLSNIVGGLAAVGFAWAGFGVWSFVVQAYFVSIINVVWLWSRPQWRPSLEIDFPAFLQLVRFGLPVFGQRLADFAGTRIIDLVIIGQIGIVAYGIYVVGARIYLTMMQLLQGAFYDVSLTVLSTIAADRERLSQVYLKTVGLAAAFISPLFVMVAALAPEICSVLFGDQWQGVDQVATPLLLLGAVQCVQFINGPFMTARGRPGIILTIGLIKSAVTVATLLLVRSEDVQMLTLLFALCQLSITPLWYYLLSRELGLSLLQIVRLLLPAVFSGALSYFAVQWARPFISGAGLGDFWQGVALGMVFFALTFVSMAFDRARFSMLLTSLTKRAQRYLR